MPSYNMFGWCEENNTLHEQELISWPRTQNKKIDSHCSFRVHMSRATAPGMLKQLMGINSQLHNPAALILVALDRRWMGSTAGLYVVKKRNSLALVTIPTELYWLLLYTHLLREWDNVSFEWIASPKSPPPTNHITLSNKLWQSHI